MIKETLCLQCHQNLGVVNAYTGVKCPNCLTYNRKAVTVCAKALDRLERDLKEKYPDIGSKKIGFEEGN